jgi:hypothetical protein
LKNEEMSLVNELDEISRMIIGLMKTLNPPSPPFSKGGVRGFEGYFPCNLNLKGIFDTWKRM